MSSNARDTPGCGTISALREGRTSLGRQYTYNFLNDKLGNIEKKPVLKFKNLAEGNREGETAVSQTSERRVVKEVLRVGRPEMNLKE